MFIVQSGSPPVNDHLVELLIMVQAAKLASAKRITAVVPWFPYTRQDKKSKPREPITAKLVADMLEVAGVDRVLTMDLHAGQIQGFFSLPVDHMTALPLFAQYYRDKGLFGEKVVAVSPDAGRVKMARRFGQMLDGDLAIMNKARPEHDRAEVTEVIGDVNGKVAILSDDMILTGGTLIAGAAALREAGRDRGLRVRDPRALLRRRVREDRRQQPGARDGDRHGRDRPGQPPGERGRAPGVATPGGDDHERLRRRVGVRDLRGRKSAFLVVVSRARGAGYTRRMFRSSFLGLVYIVIGVAVAASHHYFKHLDTIRLILSAILAVVLWPLILLGIDLHIKK